MLMSIVFVNDETQDGEEKEKLSKVGSGVRRKVRRRLLRNEGITKTDSLAAGFGDRDGCSSGEDSYNGRLTGDYNDDLTVTQFESPTKKVFTPTKKPRISPPSDCSDDEETEKEGHISDDSIVSEDIASDDDISNKTQMKAIYYQDDHSLPIYASLDYGYPLDRIIDVLLTSSMPLEHVCKVQPLGVSQNAVFLVDLDVINFEDLKADDLGSWKGTGTKKTYFRVLPSGAIRYSQYKPNPSEPTDYLHLTHRYYVHKSYAQYHRMIADVQNHSGEQNKYSMIQYWFDGPAIEVKPKPHGNSHSSTPFFRTADSAKQKHKEIASSYRPTEALYKATQDGGGELEATGMQKLPRNLQQMKNYRRTGYSKDQNILYSVMLQCKLTDGTSDAFVRDVKAAPDPQCIMTFDWQVNDLVRFLTDERKFCVFTADTTYNLGEFYVTPTTYKHLMLVDVTSKKNPTMAGPVLVHQRKNFSTFNYFASTLVSFSKKLRGLLAFGTDGDEALIEAFSHNFPFAIQLRCFLHMKRNIQSKLGEWGLPSSVSEEFLSDIFGKHVCCRYEEGLVDSVSSVDFESRLQNCKDVWNTREMNYLHPGQASFFDYFVEHYSKVFENTMLRSTRTAAGLGYPPEIFTTNASESLNATIKRRVNYKESEWPEFNDYMRQLIMSQRDEVLRALSGHGQYRLDEEYTHLVVAPQQWVKMKSEQRKQLVKQFDSMKLKCITVSSTLPVSQSTTPSVSHERQLSKHLSISAADSNISTLPKATLEAMWNKAEDYLQSSVDVVAAPGSNPKAKMVTSCSGSSPHFIQVISAGQYTCDKTCLQWVSSHICAHTLVASELNGELNLFLQWYKKNNPQPNITQLAMTGLPKGRGRKGGIPKRKRSRVFTATDVVVSRAATMQTPEVSCALSTQSGATTVSFQCLNSSYANMQAPEVSPVFNTQSGATTESFPTELCCLSSGLSRPITTTTTSVSFQVGNNFSSFSNSQVQPLIVIASLGPLVQSQSLVDSGSSNVMALSSPLPPNTNPFYVQFIEGNIRMCQGCKSSLKCANGSLLAPPFDLCCARAEKHSFRDSSGILRTPNKEQPSHYHINILCIRVALPTFVPSSIFIPPDVMLKLSAVHKEYLRLVFNVSF